MDYTGATLTESVFERYNMSLRTSWPRPCRGSATTSASSPAEPRSVLTLNRTRSGPYT